MSGLGGSGGDGGNDAFGGFGGSGADGPGGNGGSATAGNGGNGTFNGVAEGGGIFVGQSGTLVLKPRLGAKKGSRESKATDLITSNAAVHAAVGAAGLAGGSVAAGQGGGGSKPGTNGTDNLGCHFEITVGLRCRESLPISDRSAGIPNVPREWTRIMAGPSPLDQPAFPADFVAHCQSFVRRRTVPRAEHQRARFALLLHESPSLSNVAAGLLVDLHPDSVRLWRRRWACDDFSLVEQEGRGEAHFFPLATKQSSKRSLVKLSARRSCH